MKLKKELMPEISDEIKQRIQYCKDNFKVTYLPNKVTKGNGSLGLIKFSNVLITGQDPSEEHDIDGTNVFTPKVKDEGKGYFTGASMFYPSSEVETVEELIYSILSGEASGLGVRHDKFNERKVKKVFETDHNDKYALCRSQKGLAEEYFETVHEKFEDGEIDEDFKYSQFYVLMNDFSRSVTKHHINKLDSSSFTSFKDCITLTPDGESPVLGRVGIRVKTGATWQGAKVKQFDESILDTKQDYTEGQLGRFALADVVCQVYCGVFNKTSYYVGLGSKVLRISQWGFSGGDGINVLETSEGVDEIFQEAEDQATKNLVDKDVPWKEEDVSEL